MEAVIVKCGEISRSATASSITDDLVALRDDLNTHFAYEEELMTASNFKYAEAHKNEHSSLRRKLENLIIQSRGDNLFNSYQSIKTLLVSLEYIFITHIDHYDMQIEF